MFDGKKKKEKAEEDEAGKRLDALEEQMKTIATSMQTMGRAFEQMPQSISASVAKGLEGLKPNEDENKKTVSDGDLEKLSRADFMDYILAQLKEEVVKPIGERLDKGDTNARVKELNEQLSAARAKHKDFDTFWDDDGAKGILRQNPTLSIEDAYELAKTKNPEKVKEIETKEKEAEEEKRKEEAEKEGKPFVVFHPGPQVKVNHREDAGLKEILDDNFGAIFGSVNEIQPDTASE